MLHGDPYLMADEWSQNSDVSAMYPIGGSEIDRDEVHASWEEPGQDLLKWAAQTE